MTRWLGPVAVLIACAIAAHIAALQLAPGLIMGRAMDELARRGVALHDFTAPLHITPKTQTVVRSSPDLFYALCRYDFAGPGPESELDLVMGAWPDYQSLSLFDAKTNNFATLRGVGKMVRVRLLPPGSAPAAGAVVSPTQRGVILIRRLAPDAPRFAAAAEAGKDDVCRIRSAAITAP